MTYSHWLPPQLDSEIITSDRLRTPQPWDLVSAYYILTKEENIDLGVKRLRWEPWGGREFGWMIRKITSLRGNWAESKMRTRMPSDSGRTRFEDWLHGDKKVNGLFREGQTVAVDKHSGSEGNSGNEGKRWSRSRLKLFWWSRPLLTPLLGPRLPHDFSSMTEQRSRQTIPNHHAVS